MAEYIVSLCYTKLAMPEYGCEQVYKFSMAENDGSRYF